MQCGVEESGGVLSTSATPGLLGGRADSWGDSAETFLLCTLGLRHGKVRVPDEKRKEEGVLRRRGRLEKFSAEGSTGTPVGSPEGLPAPLPLLVTLSRTAQALPPQAAASSRLCRRTPPLHPLPGRGPRRPPPPAPSPPLPSSMSARNRFASMCLCVVRAAVRAPARCPPPPGPRESNPGVPAASGAVALLLGAGSLGCDAWRTARGSSPLSEHPSLSHTLFGGAGLGFQVILSLQLGAVGEGSTAIPESFLFFCLCLYFGGFRLSPPHPPPPAPKLSVT